jgi:hypothetical protein
VKVRLFSDADLTNPEVQKIAHEVYEWERERSTREAQYLGNRRLFEHEPRNYRWCEGHTRKVELYFTREDVERFRDALLREGSPGARRVFQEIVGARQPLTRAARNGDAKAAAQLEAIRRTRTDPVTDTFINYYVLAEYMNKDGGCDFWQPDL